MIIPYKMQEAVDKNSTQLRFKHYTIFYVIFPNLGGTQHNFPQPKFRFKKREDICHFIFAPVHPVELLHLEF